MGTRERLQNRAGRLWPWALQHRVLRVGSKRDYGRPADAESLARHCALICLNFLFSQILVFKAKHVFSGHMCALIMVCTWRSKDKQVFSVHMCAHMSRSARGGQRTKHAVSVHVCVPTCYSVHVTVRQPKHILLCLWQSEDNLWDQLSPSTLGAGDWTQAVSLGSNRLDLLSRLASPFLGFSKLSKASKGI